MAASTIAKLLGREKMQIVPPALALEDLVKFLQDEFELPNAQFKEFEQGKYCLGMQTLCNDKRIWDVQIYVDYDEQREGNKIIQRNSAHMNIDCEPRIEVLSDVDGAIWREYWNKKAKELGAARGIFSNFEVTATTLDEFKKKMQVLFDLGSAYRKAVIAYNTKAFAERRPYVEGILKAAEEQTK